ncbi:hypothetical protein MMC25_008301 [Agyrium rufum]|nr:hypothetical protein [Agyrium rufum]
MGTGGAKTGTLTTAASTSTAKGANGAAAKSRSGLNLRSLFTCARGGLIGARVMSPKGTTETGVSKVAGIGATFDLLTCSDLGAVSIGSIRGTDNVCVAKFRDSALADPFGRLVAFAQCIAAKKRALEYQALGKRHFAFGTFVDVE